MRIHPQTNRDVKWPKSNNLLNKIKLKIIKLIRKTENNK